MYFYFVAKNKKVKKKRLKVAGLIKDPLDPLDPEDLNLNSNFINPANLNRIWIQV